MKRHVTNRETHIDEEFFRLAAATEGGAARAHQLELTGLTGVRTRKRNHPSGQRTHTKHACDRY